MAAFLSLWLASFVFPFPPLSFVVVDRCGAWPPGNVPARIHAVLFGGPPLAVSDRRSYDAPGHQVRPTAGRVAASIPMFSIFF